ncbi:putative RNA-directed DNA polymerase from transposon BS, partial [Varanus komodoensis]
LDRLAGFGVRGTDRQWFRSYLDSRFQKVVLGDFDSVSRHLCHGVPQGSILSPLLFNIYMKWLGEVIRRFGLWSHQYADDTQLYLSFSTNPDEAVAVLNWCLAEVMGWMRANKLKLKPDKMEVLLVGDLSSWVVRRERWNGGTEDGLAGSSLPSRGSLMQGIFQEKDESLLEMAVCICSDTICLQWPVMAIFQACHDV